MDGISEVSIVTVASTAPTLFRMDLEEITDRVDLVYREYVRRRGFTQDATWYLLKLQEEVGELTLAVLMRTGQARQKGLTATEIDERSRAELADHSPF